MMNVKWIARDTRWIAMSSRRAALIVPALLAYASAAPNDAKAAIPWPDELFGNADLVGKTVTVDVLEPILDENHSSVAPAGGYDVEVTDVGAKRFGIVSGSMKLPADLHAPVRLEGTLERAPHGLQIAVSKLTQLSWPKPEKIGQASDLLANRPHFHRRYVEFEDSFSGNFELEFFGSAAVEPIWETDVKVRCKPPAPQHDNSMHEFDYRVRVTGVALTQLHDDRPAVIVTSIAYLPCDER
jgi:hypothetical protein